MPEAAVEFTKYPGTAGIVEAMPAMGVYVPGVAGLAEAEPAEA